MVPQKLLTKTTAKFLLKQAVSLNKARQ